MSYVDPTRVSHFDAWDLGGDLSKNRETRIENLEDLERVRSRISKRNFSAMRRILRGRKLITDVVKELMRTEEGRGLLGTHDDEDVCEVGHGM